MKARTRNTFLLYILAAEAVGALSGWLTRDGMKHFSSNVAQPPLSPPPIVFPIVWGVLYALMGAGAAMAALSRASAGRSAALALFWVQLGVNFLWSILFFNLTAYGVAFFTLAALWGLIVWMTLSFYELSPAAAWIQVPYLLWVLFAGYLNYGVWQLNG